MLLLMGIDHLQRLLHDLAIYYTSRKLPLPFLLMPILREVRERANDKDFQMEIANFLLTWWPKIQPYISDNGNRDDNLSKLHTLFTSVLDDKNANVMGSLPKLNVLYAHLSDNGKQRLFHSLRAFLDDVHNKKNSYVERGFLDMLHNIVEILTDDNVADWTMNNPEHLDNVSPIFYLPTLWSQLEESHKLALFEHLKIMNHSVLFMQMSHRFLPGVNEITTDVVQTMMRTFEKNGTVPAEDQVCNLVMDLLLKDESIVAKSEKMFGNATMEDAKCALSKINEYRKMCDMSSSSTSQSSSSSSSSSSASSTVETIDVSTSESTSDTITTASAIDTAATTTNTNTSTSESTSTNDLGLDTDVLMQRIREMTCLFGEKLKENQDESSTDAASTAANTNNNTHHNDETTNTIYNLLGKLISNATNQQDMTTKTMATMSSTSMPID